MQIHTGDKPSSCLFYGSAFSFGTDTKNICKYTREQPFSYQRKEYASTSRFETSVIYISLTRYILKNVLNEIIVGCNILQFFDLKIINEILKFLYRDHHNFIYIW